MDGSSNAYLTGGQPDQDLVVKRAPPSVNTHGWGERVGRKIDRHPLAAIVIVIVTIIAMWMFFRLVRGK